MPEPLTVRAIATLLHVSTASVYGLLATGTLPPVSVLLPNGRRVLGVPGPALARYVAHRMQGRTKTAELCPDDVTMQEIVRQAGVGRVAPYAWARRAQGALPTHRHGTRLVARQGDVDRYLARGIWCEGDKTLLEVARQAGVLPNTAVVWARTGVLPAHRHGHQRVARQRDVDVLLQQRRQQSRYWAQGRGR